MTGLPTNGSIVYVRLWSRIAGEWPYYDYAVTATSEGITAQPAQLTSPAAGSVLAGSTATFQWTLGTGVTEYWLWLGRTPGGSDLYDQSLGTELGATVTGLPTNGSIVYVRLWSRIGGAWPYYDYAVTAASEGITAQPAQLTSPAAGSVLAGSTATFQWTLGTGVSEVLAMARSHTWRLGSL